MNITEIYIFANKSVPFVIKEIFLLEKSVYQIDFQTAMLISIARRPYPPPNHTISMPVIVPFRSGLTGTMVRTGRPPLGRRNLTERSQLSINR